MQKFPVAGWEACSNSHQQLYSLQQPQWAGGLAAPPASPLQHPFPQQQQQQQQHHMHPSLSPQAAHMQPQSSQSLSWSQPPQPFPAAQMGGTAQAAGDSEEASMEEDTPGMLRSNSAPDLHMMLQVHLAPFLHRSASGPLHHLATCCMQSAQGSPCAVAFVQCQ